MSYAERAWDYSEDVLNGDIPACEYVKQACRRFQLDVEKIGTEGFAYHLDGREARRWCKFLETLPHVKGKWATKGELFKLSDWQVFCTVNIFGWRDSEGHRRFRESYVEVPRKNGKSYWVAGLGVAVLCLDNDMGAEVYCGAGSLEQAYEVFRPSRLICERKPTLRAEFGIEVNARSITRLSHGSFFQPIIGNPGDGSSPTLAIADEFHEHPDSDQVDTMITGMGAREQPLMMYITTAGSDMGGPCYTKRADVISILSRSVEDDRVFGIIYTLDEGDEWDTVEAQVKANPNYGISVNADFLEGQLKQARRSPSKQAAYKTKHLNMWVGAKAAWMNMLAFQACRKKDLKIEDFKGRKCYIGIDLASKTDLSCAAILFPPCETDLKYTVFCKHYLPEDTINESDRYRGFHAGGWLTATPGNVTDYEYIEDDIRAMKSDYQIVEIPYDPFQATYLVTRLLADGFPMVEVGATVKNFSEPMKSLEALILEKKIQFDYDPVYMWAMGNVTARLDLKDNIFPTKEVPENRIDPVVATIMTMNRALPYAEDHRSVYETRGLLTIDFNESDSSVSESHPG